MKGKTDVESLLKWENNKIVCHCPIDKPKCENHNCEPDILTHDKYKGIKECFKQNKYGK